MTKNKYQFKDQSSVIHLAGGEKVTAANLTDEKYQELVKLAPGHADLFEEVKESAVKKADEKK